MPNTSNLLPPLQYFSIVWTSTFFALYFFSRKRYHDAIGGYEKAVVQAFTAGSNNFVSLLYNSFVRIHEDDRRIGIGYRSGHCELWD